MRIPESLAASLAAMAIFVAAAGCDSASPSAHTIHTDSAGIPIATAIEPLWGPGDGWTVEPEPLLEIGAVTGAPEYLFTDVVAAVRLSTGDIVVAERAASELRSYDAAGNFQWRAGRDGEGPGEFRSLDFVGTAAGDSLVTYDGALLRAQLFDPQGRLARTYRVAISEGEATGRGTLADKAVGVVDGLLVVRFIESGDEVPTGVVRWPLERLAALDFADGAVRSLIVLPGLEQVMRAREEGGLSRRRYLFANGPEYGAAAGRLAVIDTEGLVGASDLTSGWRDHGRFSPRSSSPRGDQRPLRTPPGRHRGDRLFGSGPGRAGTGRGAAADVAWTPAGAAPPRSPFHSRGWHRASLAPALLRGRRRATALRDPRSRRRLARQRVAAPRARTRLHPVPGALHGDRRRLRARGLDRRAGRSVRPHVPDQQDLSRSRGEPSSPVRIR